MNFLNEFNKTIYNEIGEEAFIRKIITYFPHIDDYNICKIITNAALDGIDLSRFIEDPDDNFNVTQLNLIRAGIKNNYDINLFAKSCFTLEQMYEIYKGLEKGIKIRYANPAYSVDIMQLIREYCEKYNLDIVPYITEKSGGNLTVNDTTSNRFKFILKKEKYFCIDDSLLLVTCYPYFDDKLKALVELSKQYGYCINGNHIQNTKAWIESVDEISELHNISSACFNMFVTATIHKYDFTNEKCASEEYIDTLLWFDRNRTADDVFNLLTNAIHKNIDIAHIIYKEDYKDIDKIYDKLIYINGVYDKIKDAM